MAGSERLLVVVILGEFKGFPWDLVHHRLGFRPALSKACVRVCVQCTRQAPPPTYRAICQLHHSYRQGGVTYRAHSFNDRMRKLYR